MTIEIDHKWDKPASGVDWSHWWSPSPSMQKWLPWGSDKKSVVPQVKNFYLNDDFRKGCNDLGISIDESALSSSGVITFTSGGKGGKEVIIDSAESLPIEAIYYMMVVQDKAKLERICEFIDDVQIGSNEHESNFLKQDLLNIVMTFHNLLGTEPKNITSSMLEQCIMDSLNYTPEQRQEMHNLIKKKREIIKSIMGLFEHMQVPVQQQALSSKKRVRIVIDKDDSKALLQAKEMQQKIAADGDCEIDIVDIKHLTPKIKSLIAEEAKSSDKRTLVEERFAGLICSAGAMEVLRRQFNQDGVTHILIGVTSDTSPFVSGIGASLNASQTLWSINGDVPSAMKQVFNNPKEMRTECLVSDPNLVRQYPDICVLPGQGSDFNPPTHPHL